MHFEDGWATAPLQWVMDALGRDQLDRMATDPGMTAAVDQHAAVLRDTIPIDREILGDYVLGFVDELRERGWTFTTPFDPAALRLTAACWLARRHGFLTGDLPA
ncbi:MAG TPA: DUF6401 family natural product biosynthesis protein [Nonomuraea sp.]|uniref:DUF6401 family natural product biosynthesis protein n=1 Tax=Nonomuraea sp. NPDC049649 TaxID=3155776 RepID=UPI002BE51273|nr:DUF6401 family natural product biosynthesis protein [Nonomuraea sp.]